ncbi:MAG: hypothetical protein IAG13_11990 [Deltaproteobacteria bacterium]|nr:hypothetical protein [Nannocystaceae bacterium]
MLLPRLATIAFVMLGVCAEQPTQQDRVRTTPVTPPPPDCRDAPPGEALAQWPAGECPLVLLLEREGVRLESLAKQPPSPWRGKPPECSAAPCRFEGLQTPLGPMIVASEPTANSEMPRAVHLGVALAGSAIAFVDLWAGAGASVVEDSTELGPAHALVPMQCGRKLGLFAGARLPAGEAIAPPLELIAREGVIAIDDGSAELRPGTREGCTPLVLPLP